MTFKFSNNLGRKDAGLAIVAASGLPPSPALPAGAEAELLALLESRKGRELAPAEEARRAACRNLLRNGTYKPTGRGKPASEYLLGAAKEGVFPRVNALVDINNLVSLKHLLPISLWDADLCQAKDFEFRLGKPGENYIFNPSGQELDLEDLVCGCELPGGSSRPVVTPIKDGMRTKVRPETGAAIGAIYYPAGVMPAGEIEAVNAEFLEKLLALAPGARGGKLLLLPGETKTLEL